MSYIKIILNTVPGNNRNSTSGKITVIFLCVLCDLCGLLINQVEYFEFDLIIVYGRDGAVYG